MPVDLAPCRSRLRDPVSARAIARSAASMTLRWPSETPSSCKSALSRWGSARRSTSFSANILEYLPRPMLFSQSSIVGMRGSASSTSVRRETLDSLRYLLSACSDAAGYQIPAKLSRFGLAPGVVLQIQVANDGNSPNRDVHRFAASRRSAMFDRSRPRSAQGQTEVRAGFPVGRQVARKLHWPQCARRGLPDPDHRTKSKP